MIEVIALHKSGNEHSWAKMPGGKKPTSFDEAREIADSWANKLASEYVVIIREPRHPDIYILPDSMWTQIKHDSIREGYGG